MFYGTKFAFVTEIVLALTFALFAGAMSDHPGVAIFAGLAAFSFGAAAFANRMQHD